MSRRCEILQTMCRLCGVDDAEWNIFGKKGMTRDISGKINKFLPGFDIWNDGSPAKICVRCVAFLDSWNSFYEKAMEIKVSTENCDVPQLPLDNSEEERNKLGKRLSESELEFLSKLKPVELNGKLIYQCDQCPHYYDQTDPVMCLELFENHYNNRHNKKRPVYSCDICSREFSRKDLYVRHSALKHNIGPQPMKYTCHDCGKTFLQKVYLLRHMTSHYPVEIPTYMCHLCGQSFKNKNGLTKHMKKETGELDFQCKTCGKSYVNTSLLKNHMLRHSNEKKFQCPLCGNMFKSKWGVDSHIKRVHSGIRNYHCHICSASFTCSNYIKQHLKVKHQYEQH